MSTASRLSALTAAAHPRAALPTFSDAAASTSARVVAMAQQSYAVRAAGAGDAWAPAAAVDGQLRALLGRRTRYWRRCVAVASTAVTSTSDRDDSERRTRCTLVGPIADSGAGRTARFDRRGPAAEPRSGLADRLSGRASSSNDTRSPRMLRSALLVHASGTTHRIPLGLRRTPAARRRAGRPVTVRTLERIPKNPSSERHVPGPRAELRSRRTG